MEESQSTVKEEKVLNPSYTFSDKNTDENMKKSKKAEDLFGKYLDKNKIPYYYITQSKEKYSEELYKKNISRPDYIIHTEKGIYYVDVKYRIKMHLGKNIENRFYLNQDEIIKLYNFQRKLNSCVWISFISDFNKPKFFYASISDIFEYYDNIRKCNNELFVSLRDSCLENYSEIYEKLFVYIPEIYLFNYLSFEKAFYKNPDNNFFEQEAKLHELKWNHEIYNYTHLQP